MVLCVCIRRKSPCVSHGVETSWESRGFVCSCSGKGQFRSWKSIFHKEIFESHLVNKWGLFSARKVSHFPFAACCLPHYILPIKPDPHANATFLSYEWVMSGVQTSNVPHFWCLHYILNSRRRASIHLISICDSVCVCVCVYLRVCVYVCLRACVCV